MIGSSWPTNYPTEQPLVPFGGYSDLGSFAGGVALATGTFDPGTVPDWVVGLPGPGDETAANLYASSTGEPPAVAAVTHVTVRNVIPEPSALALLVSGLIGLLAYAWRKRR